MEDDKTCILSDAGLNNKCDKSTNQVFHLSLKAKIEDAKSPKELIMDEDPHKVSNRYNNIAKNVSVKATRRKVKLNGNIGSSVKTNKCVSVVIPDESIESVSKQDRTQNDINTSGQGNEEGVSLETVRKRKTCVSPDSISGQHNSSLFENTQNTNFKKRKVSRVSIPTQSFIPQADIRVSQSIEDYSTVQKTTVSPLESRGVLDAVEPDTHLTGFAQYLGLQPIVKFRCFKCEETGFPSLNKLQEHQNACLKNLKVPLIPKPSQPLVTVDPSLSSTNFRISRKVFLCGSCGTYYENWNLFLHMREVHKRLICLYCLTMFSQIDMLSAHLTAKHGIVETIHSSAEDLLSDCKGSCFLMCCDCDAIFTERDDFSNHKCVETPPAATACHLCGMRSMHFPTCPRAGATSSSTSTSSSCSFPQTASGSTVTDSKPSPQTTHEHTSTGASVTKYLIPVTSVQVPLRKTTVKKSRATEDNQESDVDDDYDISNAASFCHVNIHEAPEKTSVCGEVRTTGVCQKSITIPCVSNTNDPNILITGTVSSNTDTPSIHKSDILLKKINFNDKTSPPTSPVIEDLSSDNRNMEQECDTTASSDGNVKGPVDDVTQIEESEDNTSQQHDSGELSQPSSVVNISISSPTSVNNDEVSHSEQLGANSSQVTASPESEENIEGPLVESVGSEEKQGLALSKTESEKAVCLHSKIVDLSSDKKHNISINTDLISAASQVVETEIKLSTCNVSKPAAVRHLLHLEKVEGDFTDELRTDGSDFTSPVIMSRIDSKSPVRIAEADIESSVSLDEAEDTKVVANPTTSDIFGDQAADTDKTDFHDTQSLTRNSFDSMSPLTDDAVDEMTSNKSLKEEEEIYSQSPKGEKGSVKSPTLDQIDLNLPESSDAFDSKFSPPEAGGIDSDDCAQDEIFDQLSASEITDSNKSPIITPLIDAQTSEKLDIVDYRSPERAGWSDRSKSPLMTELEDSSTSSLRIELNSSESVPSNEPSKSPVEFNYSKSPLSGELNSSSRNSPNISQSPLPENEIDTSKSPLRTPVLHDSSRSSSRASSVEIRSMSPSPLECPNTENSTDTSYLHPSIVTEAENDFQTSVFERDYISKTQMSPASLVEIEPYMPTTSCTENILKSNADIGVGQKLQIATETPVTIPKTMFDDESSNNMEMALPTTSLSDIGDINTLQKGEDDSLFATLDMHKNNVGAPTNKNSTKAKKKRPSRGGRRVIRKAARRGKKLKENISESENSVPVEAQDDSMIKVDETSEFIQLAGDDCVPMELHLEDDLEALTIQVVMQESVKLAYDTCVYCNHAKKIAVNGKQLALHLLAEHKFIPIYTKCESTDLSADDLPSKKPYEVSGEEPNTEEAEKLNLEKKTLMDQYMQKLKCALPNLQDLFLNTDTYDSSDRTFSRPYDRTYECFHCHFVTVVHKDLYVHNRKMHQKTILLCIMCKSNFYSYSELLCHLCPGIYVPESSIKFRCHICSIDTLPSTFRLMVHLRKRHSVCDVCLETTDDQQKLSTHVWKHKLHHLCYRCGIAYRNKPDITKHLFWKHGTESVLCKKCLQKKWPHVYHFCIPPNAFICEECSASFTRAVALKVHKRLHTGDFPHCCEECEEHFISKRLLEKHQEKHRHVPELSADEPDWTGEESILNISKDEECESPTMTLNLTSEINLTNDLVSHSSGEPVLPKETLADSSITLLSQSQNASKPPEKKVDVYDLPPLNLSSDSDDSDAEELVKNKTTSSLDAASTNLENVMQPVEEDSQQPVPIVDGIWDNFQNYKANLERRESQNSENMSNVPLSVSEPSVLTNVMLDHDYCVADGEKVVPETDAVEQTPTSVSVLGPIDEGSGLTALSEKTENEKNNGFDHDYCFNKNGTASKDDEKKEDDKTSCLESSINVDSSIKKQKSQKKKKQSASSSSSDSSSSSGSSSCSCGDNCSCSSSSSSSGSSSDSSDSDRSTSESRRRQIARKDRRQKIRRKKEEEGSLVQGRPVTNSAQEEHDDVNQACVPPEPEEKEIPILESDLDTDETETDEDFYDQHPQLLANKLMAEKRNQLLLLAAVAPANNNVVPQPEPSNVVTPTETVSPQRKKVKSKKRKKRQHDVDKSSDNKLKLNLSTNYYSYQASNPDFYKAGGDSHTFSPMQNFSQISRLPPAPSIQNILEPTGASSAAESGSETDSKRLSKRRRMPKKFYGDSSDEDSSSHTKWSRKPAAVINPVPVSCPPPVPPSTYKNVNPLTEASRVGIQSTALAVSEKSEEEDGAETESELGDMKKSSSESSSDSDAEKEMEIHTDSDIEPPLVVETEPVQQVVKKNENVFCYCQCPYDEVSEMIACDGKDCKIEWFHFECVGIIVPPKGKWFCPDCKKRIPTKNQHL